jgi:hypothetical protein
MPKARRIRRAPGLAWERDSKAKAPRRPSPAPLIQELPKAREPVSE